MNAISAALAAVALAIGCLLPIRAKAQTQTYPCETVMQFGTGMTTNGAKLRPGSLSSPFVGVGAIFPDPGNTYVLTNPLAAWLDNAASPDSQWIGPSPSTGDDSSGVYIYYLPVISPCAGARITGRYAASDNGAVRLNGAPAVFPTPVNGDATWTTFTFNNLLSGLNRLEFLVTNNVGGRPNATGLRAELTVTATCCPCIELNCPADIFLTTCATGAAANFSITGTNRCYTNLTVNCVLAAAETFPVTPSTILPLGTNSVRCTGTDTVGHRASCSFRVVVNRDTQPPGIRCPQDIVYLCQGGGTNVFYAPTATDASGAAPIVTCVPPSGSFFPPGTNQVTCEARDACGQIGRCSFRVLILPNGFTKTLQAGVADNFSPAGLEPTTPGPCVLGGGFFTGMPFDTAVPSRHLSHSFGGLPSSITAAKLILHMKPLGTASQDDVLRIGLQTCSPPGVWAFAQAVATLPAAGGTWGANAPTTFALDLAALPGGLNLLALINASQRLEFAVGTDTLVDFARLEVTYCGPQSAFSGVPYSLSNVQAVHQGDGISWRTLDSNGPPPTIALDVGRADGFCFNYPSVVDGLRICKTLHPLTVVHPKPGGLTVTARILDIPVPGQPFESVLLEQPGNPIGKKIEVWNGDQLVTRHFFAGSGSTEADVPGDACVVSQGFAKDHYFVNFASPQLIVLPFASAATRVSGGVGPDFTGTSVRLYFRPPVTLHGLDSAAQPVITLGSNSSPLGLGSISLLQNDTWIDGFGLQQLTVSDTIYSQAVIGAQRNPYGDCIQLSIPGPIDWSLELNGVADFCEYPDFGAPQCNDGYVDVALHPQFPPFPDNMTGKMANLRITPTALPFDDCHIQYTAESSMIGGETSYSLTINREVGGPIGLRNISEANFSKWPLAVEGILGPEFFYVALPAHTVVTVGEQNYTADGVSFNASGSFIGLDFAKVCIETTLQQKMSFKGFSLTGSNLPPDCVTLTCPTNVLVNATNEAGAIVTFNPSGATRCGSNVVVTCEPPSGAFFPPGLTVVHCSAVDSQGSQDECRFLVTVNPALQLRATAVRPDLLELRWTGDGIVEFTESLIGPAAWREITSPTESNGVERLIRVAPSGEHRFFRLRGP